MLSNRYLVEYSFTLQNAAREPLFSGGTKDTLDPLIAVQDRVLDIKIPLKCLAVNAPSSGIEIREANSLAKILPYQVDQFQQ